MLLFLLLFLLVCLAVSLAFHFYLARVHQRALNQEAASRAEAQRSVQARTALLAMVSHEIRTPLQTMLANVELLSVSTADAQTADIADRLLRSLELISGQLDNIAQYAMLANGPVDVRLDSFLVADQLRRIVDDHTASAASNRQTIDLNFQQTSDLVIRADPIRFQQVINNYLSNSIKYSGPGQIAIRVRRVSHLFGGVNAQDAVEVSVIDQGPGIALADQASLWEPFVRGKSSALPRTGSGLGLAVVKLIATSVAWEIGLDSEPGQGARFFVVLPI